MAGFDELLSIPGLKFTEFKTSDNALLIYAVGVDKQARCPVCGYKSHSVHSYYIRTICDLPVSDHSVIIHLKVRKFFCRNKHCQRKIFSEQPTADIGRYARMTSRTMKRLLNILKETSARKGAFLSKAVLTPVSPSKALRIVCLAPVHEEEPVYKHIGIDDWAYRKGISYGTVLINMDNGKVIDLLPERDGKELKKWIIKHPGIELICRDRAGAYAKAVNETLPDAEQVADRFHLVKNFSEAVFEIIRDNYTQVVNSVNCNDEKAEKTAIKVTPQSIIKQRKALNERGIYRNDILQKVKVLHRNGVSQNGIARTLGINFRTVNKYMQLNKIPDLGHARLDYSIYLPDIWKDMANGIPLTEIYNHICEQGFKGCFKSFWSQFHNEAKSMKGERNMGKQQQLQLKERFSVLSPKKISIYLTYKDLNTIPAAAHRQQMIKLVEKNELIKTLYQLFLSFRETLLSKQPERLDEWLNKAIKTGIIKLNTFVRSLKMDLLSVKNAIRFDYNSGMVEGCVNRLKNIKRQMYGRASLDLLKRKVILSTTG